MKSEPGALQTIDLGEGEGYFIAVWNDDNGNSSIIYDRGVCRWTVQDLLYRGFFGAQYGSEGSLRDF